MLQKYIKITYDMYVLISTMNIVMFCFSHILFLHIKTGTIKNYMLLIYVELDI